MGKKIKAPEGKADEIGRTVATLLKAGALSGSLQHLRVYVDSLIDPQPEFPEYSTTDELPVALADIHQKSINMLEDMDVTTVGEYRARRKEIFESRGFGSRRYERLVKGIESLLDRFVDEKEGEPPEHWRQIGELTQKGLFEEGKCDE